MVSRRATLMKAPLTKKEARAKFGVDLPGLNIANVRRWVRALRSGKFQQTKGELYDGQEAYCVLGVAAHLSGVEDSEIVNDVALTHSAMEWLGVDNSIPRIGHHSAAYLNDTGKSFTAIASLIETYWIKPYQKFQHCFKKTKRGA